MPRLTVACIMLLITSSAQALTCTDMRTTADAIRRATTKAAVVEAMVASGAKRDDAENMVRASPDTETAQAYALGVLAPHLQAACAAEAPKR